MKELTIQEFEALLCSTGYLPPRNEEELVFFEQMCEGQTSSLTGRHVDVDSILNGTCHLVSMSSCREFGHNISSLKTNKTFNIRYSMAARNFNKLPKEVLEKMKNQHNSKKDDE